ncbi:MAG: TRAP transporter substrate-binding protein [bacterium]|nr:TRAP transporter substrate-binding protein [bacterium]
MKRKIRNIVLIAVVALTVGYIYSQNGKQKEKQEQYIFRLAEVHSAEYPTTKANEYFAKLVEERTEGRIKIKVYADGVLGEEIDVIEGLQYGGIDFARISIAPIAEYVEEMNSLMLPYLYADGEHMWRVLTSPLGEKMLESVNAAGLVGLAWYDAGARSYYLNTPIDGIEDLKGKKIRVQTSSLMFAMCEELGATPKSMPESRINQGVIEKTIDGAENNISTYEAFGHYESCKYYLLDEHTRIPEMIVASDITMKKLSEEDQEIIKQCGVEAGEYERVLWNQAEQAAIHRLEEKGVIFITPSEEMKQEARVKNEDLYNEFAGKYKAIIDQIQEMK